MDALQSISPYLNVLDDDVALQRYQFALIWITSELDSFL